MQEWLERLFLAEGVACRCEAKWRHASQQFRFVLTYKGNEFSFLMAVTDLILSEADIKRLFVEPAARQILCPRS